MAFSELAAWWDQQRKESEKILEQWVEDNPQWWAIGLATATSTAMELGGGLVDALRFGEGIAEGGIKGVGKDVMRMLVVVGPLGRAGGYLGRLAHTQALRLAVTTKGVTGPCTFTAVNNAAAVVGGKARNLFLTAREAAKALGKPLTGLAKVGQKYKLSAWIDDLVPFLAKQGIKTRSLGVPKTVADVVNAANAHNGVIVFAIEWTDRFGKIHRHSMIAFRTVQGVRFADYGGKFIASLSELAKRGGTWQAVGDYTIAASRAGKGQGVLVEGLELIGALDEYAGKVFKGGMLLIEGVQAVETPDSGVDIAIPVAPAAAIEAGAHEPEVLKQSFEAFKARRAGRTVIRMEPIVIKGRRKGPPPSHQLTGVQYRLSAVGFPSGPVDGVMGPITKKAVTEFQKAYGLKADGIPGPDTQAKLVEVCGF